MGYPVIRNMVHIKPRAVVDDIYFIKIRVLCLDGLTWIFRKNSTTVPKGRHAVPLQTACLRMNN